MNDNIVLIGMPGCGKSTIGAALANKLKYTLVDSDVYITEKKGRTPAKIIEIEGEPAFRDIESSCIKEICKNRCQIISTGGGAVLRSENVRALKRGGKIILIDRDLDNIKPTPDRPLSNDREKLTNLYKVRMPIYKNAANHTVKNNTNIEDCVKQILEAINVHK